MYANNGYRIKDDSGGKGSTTTTFKIQRGVGNGGKTNHQPSAKLNIEIGSS